MYKLLKILFTSNEENKEKLMEYLTSKTLTAKEAKEQSNTINADRENNTDYSALTNELNNLIKQATQRGEYETTLFIEEKDLELEIDWKVMKLKLSKIAENLKSLGYKVEFSCDIFDEDSPYINVSWENS